MDGVSSVSLDILGDEHPGRRGITDVENTLHGHCYLVTRCILGLITKARLGTNEDILIGTFSEIPRLLVFSPAYASVQCLVLTE